MEKEEIGIKELFLKKYSNKSDSCISVFHFLMIYLNKYPEKRDFLRIDLLNVSGVLVIGQNDIKLYFPGSQNKLDTICISRIDSNSLSYQYDGSNRYLTMAINSSEENLLEKIYLNISSCPVELREELTSYRQKILEERMIKRIEMIKKRKQTSPLRRLGRRRILR